MASLMRSSMLSPRALHPLSRRHVIRNSSSFSTCSPSSSVMKLSPHCQVPSSLDPSLPCTFPGFKLEPGSRSTSQRHSSSSEIFLTSPPEPRNSESPPEPLPLSLSPSFSFSPLVSNLISTAVFSFTIFTIALLSRKLPRMATTPANSQHVHIHEERHSTSSAAPTLPSGSEPQPSHTMLFNVADQIPSEAANELKGGVRAAAARFSGEHVLSRSSLCFASTTLSGNEVAKKSEAKDGKNDSEDTAPEFFEWLMKVKADALGRGVSHQVLEWALEDVKVSKEDATKKKSMPEVTLTLDDYLKRMVEEVRISTGAARLKENAELLAGISKKFGVPSQFLVSIWGIETSYGSYMGKSDIIQSLATMGFTEELWNRQKYFRGELIEALVMLEKGTAEKGAGPHGDKRLVGSWAGAMGQCQFMPTSFREYAVDYDGDGRRDIWESKADVLASIANFLKEHGWKDGGPIFQKVQIPKKLDKNLLGLGVVKRVADWEQLHGVRLDPGTTPPLPAAEMTNLVMPNGPKGAAYLVCNNFRVILRYNAHTLYGFAVCELARLVQERAAAPYPTPQLL